MTETYEKYENFSTYVLQKQLSRAGYFSDVYLAMNIDSEVPVAVKVLTDGCSKSLDFLSEVNFLRQASHANVVSFITEFGIDTQDLITRSKRGRLQDPHGVWNPDNNDPNKQFSPNHPRVCIILEYLDGGTLTDYIHQLHRNQTCCELTELLELACQICSGVNYLHEMAIPGNPIAHGDIKPDNILLSGLNVERRRICKLADMGMSFVKDRSRRMECIRYTSAFIPSWFTFKELELLDAKPLTADAYSTGATILKLAAVDVEGEDVPFRTGDALDKVESSYGKDLRSLLEMCVSDNWESQMSAKKMENTFAYWLATGSLSGASDLDHTGRSRARSSSSLPPRHTSTSSPPYSIICDTPPQPISPIPMQFRRINTLKPLNQMQPN